MKVSTIKLVLTALFMALTFVATMFIRIPLPLGYFNLGDAFVLLSIFILGPIFGTIAGGVGSAIADLVGYITYAPGTLIIKTLMAIVSWLVHTSLKKAIKKEIISEIIAGVVGAIVMAVGYFIYETLFFVSIGVAIINLPYNLLQGALGIIVAVLVMRVIKATKILDKIK